MKNLSTDEILALGRLVSNQWMKHISKSDVSNIIKILEEKNKESQIDEKILSSIDNFLFSIKMEYGDRLSEQKKKEFEFLDSLIEAIDMADTNLDLQILTLQEEAIKVYDLFLSKNKLKIKELLKQYKSFPKRNYRRLFRKEPPNDSVEALKILISNNIIKKGWFGFYIETTKTDDELKDIVNKSFISEKNTIFSLKSTAITYQKDK